MFVTGKEDLATVDTTASPYGEAVEPEKAPEAISRAVASLPPEQMFELMKQMKLCIQNNPTEARNMLLQNPQLAYALLQAQVVMRIVDPKVAMAMLHRQDNQVSVRVLKEIVGEFHLFLTRCYNLVRQIPPIQPSPSASAAPPTSAAPTSKPRDVSPFPGGADVPPMDRPPVPPFSHGSVSGHVVYLTGCTCATCAVYWCRIVFFKFHYL